MSIIYPIFAWINIAGIFFGIQILLCFKTKSMAVKLIPVYFLLLGVLFVIANQAGAFGFYFAARDFGFGIIYLLVALTEGIVITGILPAWVIYWYSRRQQ